MKKHYLFTVITLLGGALLFQAKARTPQIGLPISEAPRIAYVMRVSSGINSIRSIKQDGTDDQDLWGTPTPIGTFRSLAFTPDGQTMIYSNTEGIYSQERGRPAKRILTTPAGSLHVSPDDRKLVYTIVATTPRPHSEIFTSSLDGRVVQRLTTDDEENVASPSWSPRSDKIIYSSGGGLQLKVMNADGSGKSVLPIVPRSPSEAIPGLSVPQWSPNGKAIVAIGNHENSVTHLYIMNADGTGFHPITVEPLRRGFVRWSPDGTKLLFAGRRATLDEVPWDIFTINSNGTGPVNVTHTTTASEIHPQWLVPRPPKTP
ncbi:Tol biopolymer transport system component [Armatimonas rosea]|uniref:Tol biopolymer transport system component n=1 Tax=Armatimonas rosea TaxID=685828 RepID=A0A7W9SM95_ARMRO|nr:Tol biopolymer transport system component [Armatimonas rosea]